MVQFATSESHIKKFMLLSCNDQKRWFDHFWNLVMFLKMSTNFQKTTFFSVTNLKKNTYMFHSNMILENVDWFPPEILNRRMFWRGIQRELTQHLKVAGTDGSSNNKNSGNGWRCVCVCVFVSKRRLTKQQPVWLYCIILYSVLPWVSVAVDVFFLNLCWTHLVSIPWYFGPDLGWIILWLD